MAQAASQKIPDNWKALFVAALAKSPNITAACQRAKVSRSWAYAQRTDDPEFAAAWDEALEMALDKAVGEAYRRGVEGVITKIKYTPDGSKVVERTREYSDTLLMFLLKAHRPEKYKETVRSELTGKDGGPVKTEQTTKHDLSKLSVDELLQLREIVTKASNGDPNS